MILWDSDSARRCKFWKFVQVFSEDLRCNSCDFMIRGAKILEKPNGFWRFRRARAKKKRMCPAWYYLTGMMVLAGAQPLLEKFEAREKVARKSPFWQKCWKSGVFPRNPQERAEGHFDNFFLKNHWVFDVFMLKSLRNLRFWKDFVLHTRMSTLPYFLQGILEIWLC